MESNKISIKYIFGMCYFVITLILFYNQAINYAQGYGSDAYAYILEAYGENNSFPFPYPTLFKLIRLIGCVTSRELAFALAVGILNIFTLIIIKNHWYRNVSIETENYRIVSDIFIISLLFVSAIYLPCLQLNRYIGVGTPNPWHNATILATRGFAIGTFFSFVTLWEKYMKKTESKDVCIFCVYLFMTTLTKPSFTFIFCPAIAVLFVYELFHLAKNKNLKWEYVSRLLFIGAAFVPTFILLIYQYIKTFFFYGEGNSGIGFSIGLVWKRWSYSIFLSVVLGLCFPIFILLANWKLVIKNKLYILSWICVISGFLEALCLYEKGPRIYDGNFFWGYYHGMQLVFITSSIIFFKTFNKKTFLYKIVGSGIYLAHLICGIHYFIIVFKGGSFA